MTQQEFFKRYKYNVRTDKIGGGGFGTVYKAYDMVLHREVAIKVSEVKTAASGKTFSLKDEFEVLSRLPQHPNIANYEALYSFESPQGVFDYAVMQYYGDGNLTEAIRKGLTPNQKEEIAGQLLDGLGFLHSHQIVHRDFKPGNILVVRYENEVIPLITDFGLSKSADPGDGSVFSNSFGGGTQRYSSPEQLQGKELRFNTDLWSYGAVLYELFTGEQLFSAGTGASNSAQAEMEIYNKIVTGNVSGLGSLPERWRRLAERCLVVDPQRRAKSVEELRALLGISPSGGDEKTEINTESPADDETEVYVEAQPKPGPERPKQGTGSAPQSKGISDKRPKREPDTLLKKKPQTSGKTTDSKRKIPLWVAIAGGVAIALAVLLVGLKMKNRNGIGTSDSSNVNLCYESFNSKIDSIERGMDAVTATLMQSGSGYDVYVKELSHYMEDANALIKRMYYMDDDSLTVDAQKAFYDRIEVFAKRTADSVRKKIASEKENLSQPYGRAETEKNIKDLELYFAKYEK